MCPRACRFAPRKCHSRLSELSGARCARPKRKQEETRGHAVPSSGWPSVPRAPFNRIHESSPARGGETEPPPPSGSRRLRGRARHFAAMSKEAVPGTGARARARARARDRIRPPAARGEHLGPACARAAHGGGHARAALARHAPRAARGPRSGAVTGAAGAVAQGLVRLPAWRARAVLAALAGAFLLLL